MHRLITVLLLVLVIPTGASAESPPAPVAKLRTDDLNYSGDLQSIYAGAFNDVHFARDGAETVEERFHARLAVTEPMQTLALADKLVFADVLFDLIQDADLLERFVRALRIGALRLTPQGWNPTETPGTRRVGRSHPSQFGWN